ncbi:MAG: FkbM family methyltransferase [Hyphomicrobiaceae bacterium]
MRYFRANHEQSWIGPLDIAVRKVRFRCHFKDNTPEHKLLFQGRRLDHWQLSKLRPVLREGGTFIDIGANFGFFALNACSMMGDKGRVLAIEPNPLMAARLRENIALNGFKSIVVHEVAIGDRIGFARPHEAVTDHGSAGYGAVGVEAASEKSNSASMVPLIDIIEAANISHIDALKIDIEGFEYEALSPYFKSAPKHLFPHLIVIEESNCNRWSGDVIEMLRGHGYEVLSRGRVDVIMHRPKSHSSAD